MSQIKDKRQRPYSILLKKSGAIKDLFYSNKNKVAVEEELHTRNASNLWKKRELAIVMNGSMK